MAPSGRLLPVILGVASLGVALAPVASAIGFGPFQFCFSWIGGGVPPGTCTPSGTNVILTTGGPGSTCFGPEGSGESTVTGNVFATGTFHADGRLITLDSPFYDWPWYRIGGGPVVKISYIPYTCLAQNFVVNVPDGSGVKSITVGTHQDGFGDPLPVRWTGIQT